MFPLSPVSSKRRRLFCLFKAESMKPARRLFQSQAGITIVEVAMAAALLALFAAGGVQTLLMLNRKAVSARVMTNAREVVQRNIDTAMTAPFTTGSVPT